MFTEMVQGFQKFPPMSFDFDSSTAIDEYSGFRDSKRARCECDSNVGMMDHGVPNWGMLQIN